MSLTAKPVLLLSLVLVTAAIGHAENAGNAETRLRVAIPAEIAERAAAVVAGRGEPFTPVLMLSGLEVGAGEGFTFEVRPALQDTAEDGPILAVSGLEGRRQAVPKAPLRKIDLPVPLNDRSLKFLAGKTEATLVLRLRNPEGHPPLAVDKAFFAAKSTNAP